MATSFLKKSMAYLGLVDDYDDYDDYDSRPVTGRRSPARPGRGRGGARPPAPTGRIRVTPASGQPGPVAAAPSPPRPVRPRRPRSRSRRPSRRRPTPASTSCRRSRFADAVEIANRLMSNQPVIVNMQTADRDLQRRMIDFCSGATYALSGGMERVADEVFLLTPSNVKVSDEERQRLADHGLVSP